jgi:hypothetical protein
MVVICLCSPTIIQELGSHGCGVCIKKWSTTIIINLIILQQDWNWYCVLVDDFHHQQMNAWESGWNYSYYSITSKFFYLFVIYCTIMYVILFYVQVHNTIWKNMSIGHQDATHLSSVAQIHRDWKMLLCNF